MFPNRISLLFALLLPTAAVALSSDREQPAYITADRVEINERTGISRYIGNVEFIQGSMRMNAERVTVYREDGALDRVEAQGDPVKFRQRPDDAEEDIRGRASHMLYNADDAVLRLTGDAHIWQENDEFAGERIVYESERDIVRASGGTDGNGRVRAVIHPKEEKGE